MRLITLLITLGIHSLFFANVLKSQSPPPAFDIANLKDSIHLKPYLQYYSDTSLKMDLDEIKNQTFDSYLQKEEIKVSANAVVWLKIKLKNTTDRDSVKVLLHNEYHDHIESYVINENKITKSNAGRFTNYSKRKYPSSRFHIPITVPKNKELQVYVRLENFRRTLQFVPSIQSISFVQIKLPKLVQSELRMGYFYVIFLTVLLAVIIFSFFQFRITKDNAYAFYAIYLLGNGLYYLRNFENFHFDPSIIFFSYFLEYYYHIEPFLTHFITIMYLLFILSFLNIEKSHPKINKLTLQIIYGFIGVMIIDFFILLFFDLRISMNFFNFSRSIFTIFCLYFLIKIFQNQKNKLVYYIIFGSIFLLIPALFTLFTQIFEGTYYTHPTGIWRSFEVSGIPLYMYNVKVGILLEVFCFSLGLSFKTRKEKEKQLAFQKEVSATKKELFQLEKQFKDVVIKGNHKSNGQAEPDLNQPNIFIQKVRTIVNEHIGDENLDNSLLCKKLQLSEYQLRSKLKKYANISPKKFITAVRLEEANKLLESTDKNVSEVAYAVGYSDPAFFSRVFKKEFGKPPSEI